MVIYLPGKLEFALLGALAAVSGVVYGTWWYLSSYAKNRKPTKWVKVGEVAELCIYPVKSCKCIKLDSLDCTPFGPQSGIIKDRIFAVLDDTGKVANGKIYPRMSQVTPQFSGSVLTLTSPDYPGEVSINLNNIRGRRQSFEIATRRLEGLDCGEEIATWLSRCILKEPSGLRLIYCANQNKAKVVTPKVTDMSKMMNIKLSNTDGGYYTENVSYLLISEVSTQHLNTRTNGELIYSLNFRPNFVIKGEKLNPFEEELWGWVKIGNVVFQNISPCNRCIFTTVNPSTGDRSKSMEPLTSMKRYRMLRDERKRKLFPTPIMGVYLGVRECGRIHVGDAVYAPEA